MKTILLTLLFVTAPIGLMAAEPKVPPVLSELGKTLRHARSQPVGSTLKLGCPDKLWEMKGISKAAVFAELGSPDMVESVHSRDVELFFLMHYDLRSPQLSPKNASSSAVANAEIRYPTVTFKLSSGYVVLSVSCS